MENKIATETYKKILESMPICCIDLIIHKNNKVLLVKRKHEPARYKWWFPGGRLLKGESLKEAAVRKAREELGLGIEVEKKLGVYETNFSKGPFPDLKTGIHSINIVFIVRPLEELPEIKLDNTSSDFKWVDKIEESLDPYLKKILKKSRVLL